MCTHNNCTKIMVKFSNLEGVKHSKTTNLIDNVTMVNIYFENIELFSCREKMWLCILTTPKRGRIMKYSTAIMNKCLQY